MEKSIKRLGLFFVAGLALGILGGCSGASKVQGPGIDAVTGTITAPGDKVVIGLTHAVLGDDTLANIGFWLASVDVVRGLDEQPGFIGYALQGSVIDGYAKTMTLWQDEASLNAFVKSEAHSAAMRDYRHVLVSGTSFARHVLPKSADGPTPAPNWAEAEAIMAEHGVAYY